MKTVPWTLTWLGSPCVLWVTLVMLRKRVAQPGEKSQERRQAASPPWCGWSRRACKPGHSRRRASQRVTDICVPFVWLFGGLLRGGHQGTALLPAHWAICHHHPEANLEGDSIVVLGLCSSGGSCGDTALMTFSTLLGFNYLQVHNHRATCSCQKCLYFRASNLMA